MSADVKNLSPDTAALRRNLWQLSYPTMISFALQSFYDIVDMAWIGSLSLKAMSGVTLFSIIYMLFTVLNEIAGASSVSMIAQSHGRGDKERTRIIAEQTITFKIVLAVISGLLLYLFLEPLLRLYSTDEEVINAALSYGRLRIFFLPAAFSSYSVNTIFRCSNDAKTPMRIMVIATVLNIVLDPLLIFKTVPYIGIPGAGLGVFGAALATVIATTVSFLYGFFILLTGRRAIRISVKGLLRLDRDIDLALLTIGFPSGVQLFVRQAFNATLMSLVSTYGTVAIAVAGLASRITSFVFMPIFGFMMAGSTLVGHSLGRENVEEAVAVSNIAVRIVTAVIGTFTLFAELFPEFIIRIFNSDPTLLSEGRIMVRFIAVAMLIASFAFGRRIVFSGSGHNRPQLYSVLISRWFVQLPVMFVFVKILNLPLHYLWVTYVLAEIAELCVVLYHYRKGVWKSKRV